MHEVRPGDLRRAPGLPGPRGARRRAALLRLGRRDAAVPARAGDDRRRRAGRRARARVARGRATGCSARWTRGGGLLRWHRAARRAASSSRAGATRSTRRLDVARQRDPARGRLGARAAGRRRRHPGRGARGAARAGAAVGRSARTPRPPRRWPRASARLGTPTRWRSTRDDRPVRGAGSQLGWLLWAGRSRSAGAAERLCAARRAHRLRPAHALGPPPAFDPRPTTAARSGRSTRGWAGAGCAPRGTRTPPSASARACSRASSGSGTTPSSTR